MTDEARNIVEVVGQVRVPHHNPLSADIRNGIDVGPAKPSFGRAEDFAATLENKTTVGQGYGYGFWGPNPNLRPEFAKSYELGTELSFLDDRLGIDATVYRKQTTDQIVQNLMDVAKIEKPPSMEGKRMTAMLAPKVGA